jgi:phosphosulfolactate phosphohydrolase-like enzyme
MAWYSQSEFDLRFERGLAGARRLATHADVTIVVDVLSFSTCVEIGAGVILSKLRGTPSPEAIAAIQIFERFKNELLSPLTNSSSGKELIEREFPEDIELAAMLDTSDVVPVHRDKAFVRLTK